ncbi:MAG: tetratricopeptide repeat protein [Deltaproteobacteria bacterium]|nr:tetratricopeptide repeat protein [Deltaproteobacteria bacterium]
MRIKSILNNIAFIQLFLFVSVFYSQSQSELVQEGINNYKNGNYVGAINYFNKAINNLSSSSSGLTNSGANKGTKVSLNQGKYVKPRTEQYTEARPENNVEVRPEQYAEVRPENYISTPMENIGEEKAKLYLYRGRSNMQLGKYNNALNDFDKAVSIDPSFSDAFFHRALANYMLKSDDICGDLLKASEMGHSSAKMLHNDICNK